MEGYFNCDVCISVPVFICITAIFVAWSFFPKPEIKDFHSKYVLITGCDSGFGRRMAVVLDKLGFQVIATCLTQKGKESIRDSCSDRTFAKIMDVTDSIQIKDVFEEVKKIIPDEQGLWALVNNAGYMTLGPVEWFKLEEYKRMADVNLWGLIDVTKTFLPLVKKAKGRVVNFSSVAGLVAPSHFAAYSITKYGVEAFSDALRREMKQSGVRVSIMEPQAFQTPLLHEIRDKKLMALWNGISDDMRKEYGEEYLEECKRYFEKLFLDNACKDIDMVVNDVIDAIKSRDPRPRYVIGREAKAIRFTSLLPSAVQDYIFKPK